MVRFQSMLNSSKKNIPQSMKRYPFRLLSYCYNALFTYYLNIESLGHLQGLMQKSINVQTVETSHRAPQKSTHNLTHLILQTRRFDGKMNFSIFQAIWMTAGAYLMGRQEQQLLPFLLGHSNCRNFAPIFFKF